MPITQAMGILGLSRQRIYGLINEGRLNRFYVAGRVRGMVPRLLADDVYAYAAERSQVAKPRPRTPPPPRRPRPVWPEPNPPLPPPPVTDEDRIVAVLLLTGIVELNDIYRVANQRRVAAFQASGLNAMEFINAGG